MDFFDSLNRKVLSVSADVEELDLPRLEDGADYRNLQAALRGLRGLKKLRFNVRCSPQGLEVVRGLKALCELGVTGPLEGLDLSSVATCSRLAVLRLIVADKVDLAPLEGLSHLEVLTVDGTVKSLDVIGRLTALKVLELLFNTRASLRAVTGLSRLKELRLTGSKVIHWEALSTLEALETLGLGNTNIRSLEELPALSSVKLLELDGCRSLRTLEGIERFPNLEQLFIQELKGLPSVGPLRCLQKLERLFLRDTRVEDGDVSPLKQLPRLLEIEGLAFQEAMERHGAISIRRDASTSPPVYFIDQEVVSELKVADHAEAEEVVLQELRRRAPELLDALEFDSEGDRFVVRSASLSAVRAVAQALQARGRGRKTSPRPSKKRASPPRAKRQR